MNLNGITVWMLETGEMMRLDSQADGPSCAARQRASSGTRIGRSGKGESLDRHTSFDHLQSKIKLYFRRDLCDQTSAVVGSNTNFYLFPFPVYCC